MARCVGCAQNAPSCSCYADGATLTGAGTPGSKWRVSRNGLAGDWNTNLAPAPIDNLTDRVLGSTSAGAAKLITIPQPIGANELVNSDFTAMSRGTTWSAIQAPTADMWDNVGTNSGILTSIEAFSPGDIPSVAEAGSFMRCAVAGTSGTNDFAAIRNKRFDVSTLAGRWVTLSWYAKASSSGLKMGVNLRQFFGGYSIYGVGVPKTLSTTWERYSVTFQLGGMVGQTITPPTDQLNVYACFSHGSGLATRFGSIGVQSGTFDTWGWKLEPGLVATPYVRPDPAATRALCERHVQMWGGTSYHYFFGGFCTSTTLANGLLNFRAPFRTAPGPGNLTVTGLFEMVTVVSGTVTVKNIAASDITFGPTGTVNDTAGEFEIVATGLTPGAPCHIRARNDATARVIVGVD